jgi:anaerobic magnesium-protoporphyrin IX monomethyl ester cyclase
MAIKKIILMYANFKWMKSLENRTLWNVHPYNLGLLSAMIEDEFDVKIIDANMDKLSREDFAKLIKKEKPDVVGISMLTNEYSEAGFIAAEIVKQVNQKIITVCGGIHVTSEPIDTIKKKYVDYAVTGEGEYTFKKLCEHLNGDGPLPEKGILYKDKKSGKIINTGRAEFIKDLDALPLPSYHKVDFLKYATEIQRESVDAPRQMPYARIMTSRGCPFNCCFCEVGTISGKVPRCRSPENVVAEIEWLKKTYGVKSIIFDDDNMFIYRERAKKLLQLMIDKKLNVKWNSIAVAVFKLDEELLDLMKKSGCQYIDIAIESGVERVLKDIIHKPLDLNYAKKIVKYIKKLDIDLAANFVIGFPGETWDEIRETIRFAEELDSNYTKIFIATPLPNTELYNIAAKSNCLRKNFSFTKHLWTDGAIETDEFRAQDLKILRAYEWDRINFSSSEKRKRIAKMMGITEERLNEIRKDSLKRANPEIG